jgi:hypothetical protein
MQSMITLPDGRVFPEYNGEVLSWDIGSQNHHADQSAGYPKTKAIIRAFMEHRPEQLKRERYGLMRSCSDRMFGPNAKRLLAIVDSTIAEHPCDSYRAALDVYANETLAFWAQFSEV